jgi:LysM repeat protein
LTRLHWLLLPACVCALLILAGYGTVLAATGPTHLAQEETEDRATPAPPAASPLDAPELPVAPAASPTLTTSAPITHTGVPTYYVVRSGDTLFVIAAAHGSTVEAIMAANGLRNPDILDVGQVLLIPTTDGAVMARADLPVVVAEEVLTDVLPIGPQGTITERMTLLAQQAGSESPFHGTTWLTYYGRPNIPVMGILGEHTIEELIPHLRAEAEAYDRANGDAMTVTPAFHLVYGMATKAEGDGSHLAFLDDTEVISYITAAEAAGFQVILDIQIGALSPSEAITRGLKFLQYPNVHLAIDPEFAMVHEGQAWPGDPIGYVTADEVNHVQAIINAYLQVLDLPRPRLLLVHQFQSNMIVEPEKFETATYPHVALTVSVDGWGGPWAKISKYNSMVTPASPFTAFKLFYRWDEPLLLPEEALGMQYYQGSDFGIQVTPNLIIYQ